MYSVFRASHSARRLAGSSRRIVFVILRTGRLSSVALHPASRQRSYGRLQAGDGLPEEDFHFSDMIYRVRNANYSKGETVGIAMSESTIRWSVFSENIAFTSTARRFSLTHI